QLGDIIRIGGTRLQFGDGAPDGTPTLPPLARPASSKKVPVAVPVATPAGGASRSQWVQELAGQKLSHFKVGSPLARSKMGYVFHGRATRRNLAVAIKVLDPKFAKNPAAVKRFGAAMKLVLPLRHPNLVKVYAAGKTGPHCWLAMEYINGESLAAV